MAYPVRLDLSSEKRVTGDESALLRALAKIEEEGKDARSHWAPQDELDRDLRLYRGEVNAGDKKVIFKCNFIEAFIDRMSAALTDNRPINRIEAHKTGVKPTARILNKVMPVVWEDFDIQRQAFKMAHTAAVQRSAGVYLGYDPPSDELIFEIIKLNQVVADPRITEAARLGKDADYLIITRLFSTSEIASKYGLRGAAVKPDASFSYLKGQKSTVRTPILSWFKEGGRTIALARAEIKEAWLKDYQKYPNGDLMFPGGRMVIYSKDLVLWDGRNPYWDGYNPLNWFDWGVDPDHPWGRSEPARLQHIQLSFNQLIDGLIRNHLLTNFITIIANSNTFTPEIWKKLQAIEDSIVLRKQNLTDTVQFIVPQAFGSDTLALGKQLFTLGQLLTGVTDVTLGETAGSLQSGQAIEGLQEGANLMTRSRASRLEDFYKRLGQLLISRVFQFYSADRVVEMVGPSDDSVKYAEQRQELFRDESGQAITYEKRRRALRDIRFQVVPGSSAPGSRIRRGEMMLKLVEAGAASRKDMLEAADFPNPDEMLQRAREEAAQFRELGLVMKPSPK